MNLVLGFSIPGLIIIVFLVGYFWGKHRQANRDKSNVYGAIFKAINELNETELVNEKPMCKHDVCRTIIDQINKVLLYKD